MTTFERLLCTCLSRGFDSLSESELGLRFLRTRWPVMEYG